MAGLFRFFANYFVNLCCSYFSFLSFISQFSNQLFLSKRHCFFLVLSLRSRPSHFEEEMLQVARVVLVPESV